MLYIKPTPTGGRIVHIDTPHIFLHEETDADGNIVSRKCEVRTPSRGLGDTIAKATDALRIRKCRGCKGRQKKLNKLFPYKEGEK